MLTATASQPAPKNQSVMTSIKILVTNAITGNVEINSTVEINSYDFDTMHRNAQTFSDTFKDCYVSFYASNGDFVSIPPKNQTDEELLVDLGLMSYEDFCNKWYLTEGAASQKN